MSDFLGRLAARAFSQRPALRPRPASRFANLPSEPERGPELEDAPMRGSGVERPARAEQQPAACGPVPSPAETAEGKAPASRPVEIPAAMHPHIEVPAPMVARAPRSASRAISEEEAPTLRPRKVAGERQEEPATDRALGGPTSEHPHGLALSRSEGLLAMPPLTRPERRGTAERPDAPSRPRNLAASPQPSHALEGPASAPSELAATPALPSRSTAPGDERPVRGALPQPKAIAAPAPQPSPAPEVNVIIHRLEVRAPQQPTRPAPKRSERVGGAPLSLDAYLNSRSRG
ncbi:conserved hypothetical protein [Novosphingobium sp. 9U]|nr:conserved hypothetical protein [Novosphingobium sp. 9U]